MKTDDFEILRLNEADIPAAKQLFQLFKDVFGEEGEVGPGERYVRSLLKNPSFLCLSAIYKNEPVGGLTAYSLPMYNSESPELFIYDIAIKPQFQRKGIGTKLMSAAQVYCTQNGIKQMFVDAGKADAHALDFYRSMNGSEETVVQFTFSVSGAH
jgi:aminoglycoside 3-N-acetyltransferase I